MRVRTWSACVALAWGILLLMTAAGPIGSLRPAQATTRIAGNTSSNSTTSITTQVTLTSIVATAPAAGPGTAISAAARTDAASYVVQPGDTLSGIAAALGIPGGWPALYAANRRAIGNDPGLIRPGSVLAVPRRATPVRYTVTAGDTLSGIAAALGIPGGWPALYAANRRAVGPDPDAIRTGTVLAIPRPAPPMMPPTSPGSRPSPPTPTRHPTPRRATAPTLAPASAPSAVTVPTQRAAPARGPSSAPASGPASGRAPSASSGRRRPRSVPALPAGGLPRWLEIVLIAAGLLIGTAFLTEPTLAIARRRRAARPGAAGSRIVLADYDRLVVTHCGNDGTIYVLRPPDADPHAILLAARLVLAQDRYEELAGQLGVPAHWPRE
jgi:LysM repeat protein